MPGTKIAYKRLPNNKTTEILQKKFTTSFRSGYVDAEGCIMPEYFQMFGDKILDLKIRDDDVFVCSFPKCGTTWTQEMVWCIANELDYDKAKEILLPERFPFLEHTALFDYRQLLQSNSEILFPDYVLDSVGYIDRLQERRFIKTHLPLQLLPMELQNNRTQAKIIYVARDPRDCLVSYYHHCRIMEGFSGDMNEFVQLFKAGNVSFGPYWNHLIDYWNIRSRNNVLFITYEEMKANIFKVIERVSQFLGITLDIAQIDTLREHLDFNNMKKNKSVNYEVVQELNKKYGLISEGGAFMRSGKSGGFVEVLSKAQIDDLNFWCKESLKGTDYQICNNL